MNHEDPIIDPLLEELLGGQRPPDLTAQVLARLSKVGNLEDSLEGSQPTLAPGHLNSGHADNGNADNGHADSGHIRKHHVSRDDHVSKDRAPIALSSAATAAGEGGEALSDSRVMVARRRVRRARQWRTYASLAISLSLLGVLVTASYVLWQGGLGLDGAGYSGQGPLAKDDRPQSGGEIEKHGGRDVIDATREADEILAPSGRPGMTPPQQNDRGPAGVDRGDEPALAEAPRHVEPPRYIEPIARPSLAKSDDQIVTQVNQVIAQAWRAEGVQPAQPATDSEWCRRTYLQLLGRIPTVDEVQKYTSRRGKDKRQWLVDRILTAPDYQEEFASYWSARWANILVGQAGGMSADSPIDREALENYLKEAFAENRPYDAVVRELLTATGSNRPGTDDYNPATNFLVASLDQDAKLATAKACQTFLGQRLQCVECHSHPANDWDQETFWSMNAFFRQIKAEPAQGDGEKSLIRIVNQDFHGSAESKDEAEVYFEQQNGLLKVAYPKFVDGTEIPRSGKLDQVDRRQELAQLVINSDLLPQATVNRMWQHFLGVGFTTPVDDMGPHNPPSHPELLATLADDFAASGFDMRRLMRWITLSEAYGLSSKITDGNLADDPAHGQPLFARYYSRQMEAEQLFHSLTMLAKAHSAGSNRGIIASGAERHQWLGQVTQKMGDDEDSETSTLDGSVSQSLLMMNGHLMHQATDLQTGVLQSVIASKMSPREKVDHLFMAALSRKPNKREIEAIDEIIQARQHEPKKAYQDIWWALLNSNEFIVDH